MTDESRLFLASAFESVPPEHWFLIWTLPDKRSRWYHGGDIEQAVADVETLKDRDVYIGAALSTRNRGVNKRVEAADASGLVGLWADVDIADDQSHKKSNLPATEADARAVLEAMGAAPTMVVHSGHGLQAWWLFHEPWIFESPEEHDEAARLSVRWFATMKVRAATLGWTIDAVHDLARVMRLPGTTNRKGKPVPVRVVDVDGPTYNPADDFDPFIADEKAMTLLTGRRVYHVGDLRLAENAQPDIDMRDALDANDKKFSPTLNRQRKDLSDDSPSGYDMALARMCANAGWSDQQIVDLLIFGRKRHGDNLKLDRLDYYQRTIARAREDQASVAAISNLDAREESLKQAQVEVELGTAGIEKVQHSRAGLVDQISSAMGIELVRVIKLTSEPPRWQMITTAGPLRVLSTKEFMSQTEVREAIAEKLPHRLRPFSPKDWGKVSQNLLSAAEDEPLGFETTEAGLGYTWLTEYLADRTVLDDLDEALESRMPYESPEGELIITGPALVTWLNTSRGERVTSRRLGEVLRAFGCEYDQVNINVRGGKKRSTRSVWRVPHLGEFHDPHRKDS